MAKKKTATTQSKTATATIYVGPSIPGLQTCTLFRDGVTPDYVKKMAEEKPAILQLIVPISRLADAMQNINKKGHVLNHFANKLLTP